VTTAGPANIVPNANDFNSTLSGSCGAVVMGLSYGFSLHIWQLV
jgi:hypothetical protein